MILSPHAFLSHLYGFETRKYKAIFLSLTLIISACASHDPFKPLAASDLYFCDHNRQIILSIRDKAEVAAFSYAGKTYMLDRAEKNVDAETFSDGVYTLYYDDGEAAIEKDGIPLLSGCSEKE